MTSGFNKIPGQSKKAFILAYSSRWYSPPQHGAGRWWQVITLWGHTVWEARKLRESRKCILAIIPKYQGRLTTKGV